MIPKTSFKEFSKDFIEMTGDTIQRLIMARIVETPAYVIQELGSGSPCRMDLTFFEINSLYSSFITILSVFFLPFYPEREIPGNPSALPRTLEARE